MKASERPNESDGVGILWRNAKWGAPGPMRPDRGVLGGAFRFVHDMDEPGATLADLPESQSDDRRNLQRPRVGIVGAGGFGLHHLRALSLLEGRGQCGVAAICEPREDFQRLAVAEAKWSKLAVFDDCDAMLEAIPLDYVVIASPPHLHYRHGTAALDHGAFVYLEKPAVPTLDQLAKLLSHPLSDRVVVGFQMIESDVFRRAKSLLSSGGLGRILSVHATGLWPRPSSYYARAPWAGKMTLGDEEVFDGPLTNAFAHLVHAVFYLCGAEAEFAMPTYVRARLARARPIESYDFGWLHGKTESGIEFDIVAGHCSSIAIPWQISVVTERGAFQIDEADVPSTHYDLLIRSHDLYLQNCFLEFDGINRLHNTMFYSVAVANAIKSSGGIRDVPSEEICLFRDGDDLFYHVETIANLIRKTRERGVVPNGISEWLSLGETQSCTS